VDLLSKPFEEGKEIVEGSKEVNLTETGELRNEIGETLDDRTPQGEVINNFDQKGHVEIVMVGEKKVEPLIEVKVGSESEEKKEEIEHDVEVTNTMMLSHLGAVYNYLDHQKESIENLDVAKTKRMKELVDKLR
jgi:hypothetical protein